MTTTEAPAQATFTSTDPRTGEVDVVDWIERIPFSETRNYVQRVMENLQVYRGLFGAPHVSLAQNLARGTPPRAREVARAEPAAAPAARPNHRPPARVTAPTSTPNAKAGAARPATT